MTAGLATVWNSWSTRPSLAKRTVAVVSRRTVPSSSTRSSVVSSTTPSVLVAVEGVDHVDDGRDALVGDALVEHAEPAGVAEAERAAAQRRLGGSPKSTATPFGRSGTPMWPTRDPGAMPVTSATASSWAGVP